MRVGSLTAVSRTIPEMAYALLRHAVLAGAAALLLAQHAHAQVCKDEQNSNGGNGSDRFYLNCDMTYKNSEIMCDKNSVYPSCPAEPMPMRDTELKSFIKDFSPYLFAYARDPEDKTKPYTGTYYRGTPGDATQTFRMFGKGATGAKQTSACVAQLKFPAEASTVDEEAKMVRLELDNCTNQYILNSALYPYQKENTTLLAMEDGGDRSKRISLSSHCQPLKTVNETKNEYFAADYIKAAWIKLLQNPTHRKNPSAANEPHLPTGITIENPIAPPDPFPDVRLSNIAAVPYEEINDPTHPFSPRWDYRYNERDHYSPKTAIYHDPIQHDGRLDSVFCAGVRKADDDEEDKSEEDQTVKVDVLEFRRPAFDEGIMNRISYNTICKLHVPVPVTGPIPVVAAASYCFRIIIPPSPFNPLGLAQQKPCWQCFGLTGKVNGETTLPPCTTHYGGKDQRMKLSGGYLPGGLNAFSRLATCNPGGTRQAKYNIDTLCRDLRAPYTPLNKLKMRYHDPEEEDDIVLKDGVQEGFRHKEYFNNRMPYPRLWDTGRSIQRNETDQQDPLDVHGQHTAIVGVGHEATPESEDEDSGDDDEDSREGKKNALIKQDQRCLYGGWGGNVNMGGVNISVPDPIASWTELKLYQTRTLRDLNISCLGRYEKSFKIGSAENMVLSALGAEYTRGILTKPDGSGGYTYQSLAEYREAGGGSSDEKLYSQLKNEAWPLAWRGYLSAKKNEQKFPNFPGGSASTKTGLDNAELGDIVLMPEGTSKSGDRKGLPKLAIVAEVNLPGKSDCEDRKNCYVRVIEPDNGKWPDVCGTTDTWGEMKTRYLYKSGMLPEAAKAEYTRINSTTDCADIHLSMCELDKWDELKLYRVREDKRDGNDGEDDGSGSP